VEEVPDVKTETCAFYSDGVKLDGLVLLPDGIRDGERRPAVILNSGFQGLKEWVPARWWPAFTEAGYICMAFDYRGFGTSGGERGRMLPDEEAEDIESAITYLQQHRNVDPDRIGILGWGLGGAVVIAVAARDRRVRAVCCANGFGWGQRTVRDAIRLQDWFAVQDRIEEDRARRVITGTSAMTSAPDFTHPGRNIVLADTQYGRDLRDLGRSDVPEFTLSSAEAYYNFRPELVVGEISPTPLLIVHGSRASFYSVDEAQKLFERAGEPKTLVWIEGGDHLDWIHPDSPLSRPGIGRVVDWFRTALPR
jgi:uncharacterized protein